MTSSKYKIGTVVKLKNPDLAHGGQGLYGTRYNTAKIVAFTPKVKGGVRTDRTLGGIKYWNIRELVIGTELEYLSEPTLEQDIRKCGNI